MSRSDQERFADIIDAVERCQQYAPYLRAHEHTAMAYDANPELVLDIVENQLTPLKDQLRSQ